MTVWACARQGEPTTYHDTESGALAHARDRECVVYPVEIEEAGGVVSGTESPLAGPGHQNWSSSDTSGGNRAREIAARLIRRTA